MSSSFSSFITKPHLSLSSSFNISFSLPHRRRLLLSVPVSSSPRFSLRICATSSPQNPNNHPKKLSLLKSTLIAATLLLCRLSNPFSLPLLSPPFATASVRTDDVANADAATTDDFENADPATDDVANNEEVEELKGVMEKKIKEGKVNEAIGIVERLIKMEPEDGEWPLMRAHLYCYDGNIEMARLGFDDIIQKDPTRVEAYHGLVLAASEGDSGEQLKEIEKRVLEAMEICKRENRKKDDLRDFKLLIAQIRVIQGEYKEALEVYQDLVKEEPRDFRPYLCQGIILTLLKKTDEAEKQFEKYRRLVPKGHPYAQYFDDNMIATKIFGQKMENDKAAMRS